MGGAMTDNVMLSRQIMKAKIQTNLINIFYQGIKFSKCPMKDQIFKDLRYRFWDIYGTN